MRVAAHRSEVPTAIHVDLGAIFVSLDLSRSKWLITSLSPGGGEKMSKHMVTGGNVAETLACLAELNEHGRSLNYEPVTWLLCTKRSERLADDLVPVASQFLAVVGAIRWRAGCYSDQVYRGRASGFQGAERARAAQ